ncbi:ribonuclease H, partial [Trifolium medium]|nr:ribonuclease H [Trifolium medium]
LDRGIGWFSQVAVKKLGNGNSVKFWKDVWLGEQCLAQRFPRLFGISVQQDEVITNVGSWVNGEWRWGLLWRRNFFVWEETLVQELLNLILNVEITDADDGWIWTPDRVEGFSVKSLYVYLDSLLSPQIQRTSLENFAFNYIWKSGVPSKVCALVWQLFLDRLPTRDNLCRRGVIIRSEDAFCPLCTREVESSRHLFLHCKYAADIWYAVSRWLGVVTVLPANVLMSYGGASRPVFTLRVGLESGRLYAKMRLSYGLFVSGYLLRMVDWPEPLVLCCLRVLCVSSDCGGRAVMF